MKIKEEIRFITDGPFKEYDYTEQIDFVHSFGLKCDCVGWTEVEIKSEDDLELLKRIREKADEKGYFL